jgi:hypothetical protein
MLSFKEDFSTLGDAADMSLRKVLSRGRPTPKAMETHALDRKNRLLNVIDSVLELLQEGEVEV